jgi:phospholipid transport system transporter-binding protein
LKLSAQGRNHWLLSGSLNLASVPVLWEQVASLISVAGPLTISLKGVEQSSSAGLAVLLQALQVARSHDCDLKFEHIPDDLAALAQVSNVLSLLSGH